VFQKNDAKIKISDLETASAIQKTDRQTHKQTHRQTDTQTDRIAISE